MMHCPSCGNESSPDQNFCRKCGFDLGPVGELVAKGPDKAQRDRIILRHMVRWMTRGLLVVALAIIMLVAGRSFDLGRLVSEQDHRAKATVLMRPILKSNITVFATLFHFRNRVW